MSLHTHSPAAAITALPPYTRRQCTAVTNPPSNTRNVFDEINGWQREPIERPPQRCKMSCSPWLPEADYCATHLPADAVLIVRHRVEAWEELNAEWWALICADHPYRPKENP